MNIGFAGSDNFSLRILTGLSEIIADGNLSMSLVLTIPAKNQGRGKVLTETPVFSFCTRKNLFIETISSDGHMVDSLKDRISTLDYLIVASFGYILNESILSLPKYGCINVHPSLLPKWRGAAPIQRAIEAGDDVTGVSIMKMALKLDSGPVWNVVEQEIDKKDTYVDLEAKLAKVSLQMLQRFLKTPYDKITYNPQQESKATYAKKIVSNELIIDWTRPAVEIVRKINAFYPKPCTHTYLNSQRLKFGRAEVFEHPQIIRKTPGTLLISKDKTKKLVAVYCGIGIVKINLIQKENGKWIDAASFINGLRHSGELVFGGKI